jgi:TonB family protein
MREQGTVCRFNEKLAFVVAVILSLSSCYSSTINTDAPQRANATLANEERGIPSPYGNRDEQDARLWRDKPEYMALVGAKHSKELRMVAAAAPRYPIRLRWAHVEANVIVSFVVGVDGRVEDARVIESSDSRFDTCAVEAMMKFTFLPAEGAAGPERAMADQPFYFRVKK